MTQEEETKIYLIDPTELKPNPVNVDVYGEEEVDLVLVGSIKELGQLDPIVITADKTIISGHRRWVALLALKDSGIKAKCLYKHFETKLEEKEAIIECNRQREKSWIQTYNEVNLLKEIFAEKAELRRLANLKQNTTKDTEPPNSASREESGSTRDYVEKMSGVKHDKFSKIQKIVEEAKSGNEVAAELLIKGNSSQITPDAAIKTLEISKIANSDSPVAEKAKVMLDQVRRVDITPNKGWQQIKAEMKENKEKTEAQARKTTKIPQGIFNIILSDTYPVADIIQKRIPYDEDSVLFLWSSASSLITSLKLMEHWGFTYKSCTVLDKGSSTDMLLFCTHGTGISPISKIPNIIREKKRDCIYDLIEKMFPSQRYLEMFKENTRKGWNIGHEVEPEPQPPRNEHGAFIALPDHMNMLVYKIRPRHMFQNEDNEYKWLQCEIKVYDKILNCSISLGDLVNDFVFVLPNVENLIIDFNEVFKTMTPIVSYRLVDNEYLAFTRSFPSEEWNEFVASRFPELIIDEPEESEEPEEQQHVHEPETQTEGIPPEDKVEPVKPEEAEQEHVQEPEPEPDPQTDDTPSEDKIEPEPVKQEPEIKEPVKEPVKEKPVKAKKDVKPTTATEKKSKQNYTQYDSMIQKCVTGKSLNRLDIIEALELKGLYESLDKKGKHAMEEGIYKRCNKLIEKDILEIDEITSKEKGSAHYTAKTQSNSTTSSEKMGVDV